MVRKKKAVVKAKVRGRKLDLEKAMRKVSRSLAKKPAPRVKGLKKDPCPVCGGWCQSGIPLVRAKREYLEGKAINWLGGDGEPKGYRYVPVSPVLDPTSSYFLTRSTAYYQPAF